MDFKQLRTHFTAETIDLYDENEAKGLFAIVAEQLTGWGRSELQLNGDREVSAAQYAQYLDILAELRAGKPVQHLFSEAWFYGLKFKVSAAVLIPRPETEELVEWILQSAASRTDRNLQLIDIGTGSGCIAITLKKKNALLNVDALDVSGAALDIAVANAADQHAALNFINADILNYQSGKKYDVIVSNPPYIKEEEKVEMHQNVLAYEPHLALFVSNDNPLVFYRAIADFAISNLNPEGELYFEINEYLGKETVEMLAAKGFVNIELRKDMQGKDRMICCRYL